MIFIGDDWAEDHHDVYLMDEAGARLASRRLPEGLAGIGEFHQLLARHADDPGQVVLGMETDRGLWVTALVVAGYQVYAINPMAAARYRDRHHVSGAKSDAADAKLLADLVRTDRHNHRKVAGDSADAEAVKVLARAHQNLIWTRNRHTNALRSALREYYPGCFEGVRRSARSGCSGDIGSCAHPGAGCQLEFVKDPVGTQRCWATTQHRCPSSRSPDRAAHRTARRSRRRHRCIRGQHPRHRRHHHRTEPPDHRPRG